MLGLLDDLIVIPLGIWLVARMVPKDVLAEHRVIAQLAAKKPSSKFAAGVIISVWVLAAAIAAYFVVRYLAPLNAGRLNTAPCGMPFALPPCGQVLSSMRKPGSVGALLAEALVQRQLAGRRIEARDHHAVLHALVAGDHDAPLVRRDGDPVRHVIRARA